MGSLSHSGFTVCRCKEVQQWHRCDVGFLPRGLLCWQSIDLSSSAVRAQWSVLKSWTLSCQCHPPHPGWNESRGRGCVCASVVLLHNNMETPPHTSSSFCIPDQLSVEQNVWTGRLPNTSECLGYLREYKYCAISKCWPQTDSLDSLYWRAWRA